MNSDFLIPGAFVGSLLFLYAVFWTLSRRTGSAWIDGRLRAAIGEGLNGLVVCMMTGLGLVIGSIVVSSLLEWALLKDVGGNDWFVQFARQFAPYEHLFFYWASWAIIGLVGLSFLLLAGYTIQEPRDEADHKAFRNRLFGTAIALGIIGTIVSFGFEMSGWRPEVARWVIGVITMNMVVLFEWCAFFILLASTKETA